MWTWGSRLSRKASAKPFQHAGRLVHFEPLGDQSHRTRTHLDDPVSRLDAGSHGGSIYSTKDKARLIYSSIFLVLIGVGWATDWAINAPECSQLVRKHCWAHVSQHWLTFFNQLYKHWVVSTHSQPEAVLIPLDYHTALDQAWTPTRKKTVQLLGSTIFLCCFVHNRYLSSFSQLTCNKAQRLKSQVWYFQPPLCRAPFRGISDQAQLWGTAADGL